MASDKTTMDVTFANVHAIPDSAACIVSMAFDVTTTDAKFTSVTNVHRCNVCCTASMGFSWTTMDANFASVAPVLVHSA